MKALKFKSWLENHCSSILLDFLKFRESLFTFYILKSDLQMKTFFMNARVAYNVRELHCEFTEF